MGPVRSLGLTDIAIVTSIVYLAYVIVKRFRSTTNVTTTPLNGPKSESRLFGLTRDQRLFVDPGKLYEEWAGEYGSVYTLPMMLGHKKTVLLDPKAISNFYSKETTIYHGTPFSKRFIARIFGKGLLWAEGESHKRQRKALTPAFSNAALRKLTAVFYDSAYKLKTHWDNQLENHPNGGIIEVQEWMNHVALDSIGIAGFSHDFGSLNGEPSSVVEAFESLGKAPPTTFGRILFLLSFVFPWLFYVPTERTNRLLELRKSMSEIAHEMLSRSRRAGEDNSIIGLLIKAENTRAKGEGELHMTAEEVSAQMNVLLLAGYETTSISLTWALIELSKAPAKQDRLRQELLETRGGQDAEWDDLMAPDKYPYLDAVVHEVLRLHPPLAETVRVATEDDVLPLSAPIVTKDGREVTSLTIAKGTTVSAPISCMNRSELVWGKRAKEFIPERWAEEGSTGLEEVEVIPASAKEIQGYRHLLTFSDGPRTCLGKNFALSEFKAVLSVLIRNYSFELVDGPETKIEVARGILPRPKVEEAVGPKVPMMVRKVEVD